MLVSYKYYKVFLKKMSGRKIIPYICVYQYTIMHTIEYDITLNESGRPSISLSKGQGDAPEDKFLAMEITRYIVQYAFENRKEEADSNDVKNLDICLKVLEQITDEYAHILWDNMRFIGDTIISLGVEKFHIAVKDVETRNLLPEVIYYEERIYSRREGLRVLVSDEEATYELRGGSTNENWVKLL